MDADQLKRAAAEKAVALVEDNMVLGLGTGSTAAHFIDLVGEKVRDGLSISAIPSSKTTETQALAAGIDIIEPDETTLIDLAVDGADEVGPQLALIKGGGAALLREKIIAEAAKRFVVIADGSKKVSHLGAFPLPVEIEQFSWALTVRRLRETLSELGFKNPQISLRAAKPGPYLLTDGGNFIVDCKLGRIDDPKSLDEALHRLPGIVEHGLFVDMTDQAILASVDGIDVIDA